MELRYCEWANCVWKTGKWKKYRIGSKKAIFLLKTMVYHKYVCEGCVRQMFDDGIKFRQSKKIIPLTKRAEKILILLRL